MARPHAHTAVVRADTVRPEQAPKNPAGSHAGGRKRNLFAAARIRLNVRATGQRVGTTLALYRMGKVYKEMTVNLSMQIGRAVFALSAVAVVGACAFAQNVLDPDAQAPNVAHSRLEIAAVSPAKDTPHWVVASVRVGPPEPAQQEPAPTQRVAAVHVRVAALPHG